MSCFVLLVMLDAGSLEERETSRSPWTRYSIICKRNYTSRQEKLPPNVSFVQDVLFLRIGLGQIDFYISIYVLETFTVLMILNWKTKFGQWDDVWYVPSWIKLLKFSQAI